MNDDLLGRYGCAMAIVLSAMVWLGFAGIVYLAFFR